MTDWMFTHPLAGRVLELLDGDDLLYPPTVDHRERNEGRIDIAVCQETGILADLWEKKKQRGPAACEPLLNKTIDALEALAAKKPAVPTDTARNRGNRSMRA